LDRSNPALIERSEFRTMPTAVAQDTRLKHQTPEPIGQWYTREPECRALTRHHHVRRGDNLT
jgi:hypothetical protein